ncbi:MAG: RlmE family RNA methyltransferase [Parcubacteria group bacterium]|nr:RlmE family RNA methyltransferase [Parcubacteria group bacterium]
MVKPFTPNDAYARKARAEGYLARSAYKLKDIMQKFKVVATDDTVLDIGAAPGSWLQVVREAVGESGRVVGVDLSPVAFRAKNVITIQRDIFDPGIDAVLAKYGPFDAILSDASPATSGIRDHDQALSEELVERVLALAETHLAPGGSLVTKLFQSPETNTLMNRAKQMFKQARLYKPKASRERSFETYLVCRNKVC